MFEYVGPVRRSQLTKKEKKVLYGLVRYPELNDSILSKKIKIKLSTLTSIKNRLSENNYFRKLSVPLLNNLGCELLAVIYTQFNPVIPLEDRVKTTKQTIEVFEEIFFSAGEQEKGFSISISNNYSNIGRINEIRTKTFGKVGLLEDKYPNEIIFPFKISHINRFFDYSRVLKNFFKIDDIDDDKKRMDWFKNGSFFDLSEKEKRVYSALIELPDETNQTIGDKIGISRHTVSRMKKKFFENDLIRQITLPNLEKLGFEILAFYPINFNPKKSPSIKDIDILDTDSTIFLARRQFQTVAISAYPTYLDYKEDKMNKIRFLKENDFISYTPLVGKYMFDRMMIIKDFNFASISKKTLGLI